MCTKNMEFLKILSPVGLMLYESLSREQFQEFSISTSSSTSSTSPMFNWRPASRMKLMLMKYLLKTQCFSVIQLFHSIAGLFQAIFSSASLLDLRDHAVLIQNSGQWSADRHRCRLPRGTWRNIIRLLD